VITWAILTFAAICIACSFQTYWTNFFKGPFELSSSQLASNGSAINGIEYVSATGTKIVPTGVDMITTESENGQKKREYASSHFYVLVVDGGLLIVQSEKEPSLHVDGELKSLPSDLPRLIFPDEADSDLRSRIYPNMVNTTESYRQSGYIFFGCAAVWCFLLYKFAFPAWRRSQDISKHPVVQRTERWSNHDEVATLAEQQMRQAPLSKGGGIVVTEDFVIVRKFFTFNLFLWNDLLWAYKKVTTTRMYFVIPVSRTSEAILVFYGGSATVPARKKRVDDLLEFAVRRSPWAVFGHTQEIASLFKKDTNGFVAAVEARRSQLMQ